MLRKQLFQSKEIRDPGTRLHVQKSVNEGQKFSLHAQLLLEEVRIVSSAAGWGPGEGWFTRSALRWLTANICVTNFTKNEKKLRKSQIMFLFKTLTDPSRILRVFVWAQAFVGQPIEVTGLRFSFRPRQRTVGSSSHQPVSHIPHSVRQTLREDLKRSFFINLLNFFSPQNSLENVAASDFRILSSFLKLHIVSLTTTFSFSYFDFRLLRATSAVFLFDLSTVRSVAICSRLVDNSDLSLMICSWRSAISSLDSLSAAKKVSN